ncbi:MAG: DUF1772 domain-containing protein [Acidobacteriaceae bacterium]|nr:DUF1772 domain-containing protein [Acidobacteriaceae bacterium]
MDIAIKLLTLLVAGSLAGNELAVAAFIHPVFYSVPDGAHAIVVKPLAKRLGTFMPFWYGASLLLALVELVTLRSSPQAAWWLCCAAAVLLAIIIVLTILLAVPINNRIAAMDVERVPSDWLSMRRRWDGYHQIRVTLLFVVLILLILAVLLR